MDTPTTEPHILCDTDSKCEEALPQLRSSPILILDCEGRDLGTVGGALSIVILRTTTADPQTYLIDVKSLSTTALQDVFDLLFSPRIQKVVFDGRMDFSALYHEYGVELYNVVDTQLIDMKSRQSRGEKLDEQLKRLCGAFAPRELWKNKKLYEQVHRLSNLEGCLREHQCMQSKDRGGLRPKGTVDHQDWMERPLSPKYLDYAARDARLIHILFDTFTTAGWTELLSLDESMRYVTLHKYSQPKDGDQYKSHPFLPLGIMNPRSRKCGGCERQLPLECFTSIYAGEQCYVCNVCRAVAKRMTDGPPAKNRHRKGNDKGEKATINQEERPLASSEAREGKSPVGESTTEWSCLTRITNNYSNYNDE